MAKETIASGVSGRDDISARLEELRRNRGAAKLDGRPFDSTAIAALEIELEAMDEAAGELARRERDEAAKQLTSFLEACRAELVHSNDKRMDAVRKAEKALEEFGVAVRDVMKHAEMMTATCRNMGVPTPSGFTTQEHAQRISHFVALVLREMSHPYRFGRINLPSSWMPGDGTMSDIEAKSVAYDMNRLTGE